MWGTIMNWTGANKLVVYLGAALVLAILLGWLFWSRADLKGDLAQAEANVATLQGANRAKARTIEDMRAFTRRVDQVMTAREKAMADIDADRERLRTKLEEVYAHDAQALAWARQPVPASVRALLRAQ
jgi:Tfp pilus assembly protein PilO